MAAKIIALVLCLFLLSSCGSQGPQSLDPAVPLAKDKVYIIEYWEAQPPPALDPRRQYRAGVEEIAAQFNLANPGINLRIRWLDWVEAEGELEKALREGNPPDLYGDWLGLARRDHVLQVPAAYWLDQEELAEAGKNLVAHEGKLWAWPRWLWPLGLIALESESGLGQSLPIPTRWEELAHWLESRDLRLAINDWEGEFSGQALLASAGGGWGRWGGQELNQVFAGLAALVEGGLVAEEPAFLADAPDCLLGGTEPALLAWLWENQEKEALLLPLPSVGPDRFYPIAGASLLQFRQVRYKGDDHSRAAALAAHYLAREQGELPPLGAVSAWVQGAPGGETPAGYKEILLAAREKGVPSRAVDRRGRREEDEMRTGAATLLAEFWAGRLGPAEIAQGFEDLQ